MEQQHRDPWRDFKEYLIEDLGSPYAFQMKDLNDWYVLQVICTDCSYEAKVYPTGIKGRLKPDQSIMDLRGLLKCSRCGSRARNSLSIFRITRKS